MPDELTDDLVRNALSMGVAALDTYLHAAVIRSVDAWSLTGALARLDLRFDDVCKVVADAVEDRRKNKQSRPWVKVKDTLRERLLKESFQSSTAVENALRMCGYRNGWSKIAEQMGGKAEGLKERLNSIVHRRNKIVHESDQQRASRPREVRLEHVDPDEVEADLAWLEELLEAIDAVIES